MSGQRNRARGSIPLLPRFERWVQRSSLRGEPDQPLKLILHRFSPAAVFVNGAFDSIRKHGRLPKKHDRDVDRWRYESWWTHKTLAQLG